MERFLICIISGILDLQSLEDTFGAFVGGVEFQDLCTPVLDVTSIQRSGDGLMVAASPVGITQQPLLSVAEVRLVFEQVDESVGGLDGQSLFKVGIHTLVVLQDGMISQSGILGRHLGQQLIKLIRLAIALKHLFAIHLCALHKEQTGMQVDILCRDIVLCLLQLI